MLQVQASVSASSLQPLAQRLTHERGMAWRRDTLKEQALYNLPWKDTRGPSPVRRTQEPFQRQQCGNFWETGWSTYGLFWVHRYHLELNWTELLSCCFSSHICLMESPWSLMLSEPLIMAAVFFNSGDYFMASVALLSLTWGDPLPLTGR